jgi:DNA excision repair protein ERCC-2
MLKEIHDSIRESGFADDELSLDCLEWLWNINYLLDDWNHPHLSMLISCPKKGRVQISCLDASSVIAPKLESFFQTVLMSATIQPWENFITNIGLTDGSIKETDHFRHPEVAKISGTAPWLEGCFEVMVDARVDTRYRRRDSYISKTAETIADSAECAKGCTVVFFPSYRYAETVMERLQFTRPLLRTVLQPRDLPLEEQTEFLESALMFQDVLLLVLGSRFSEGIDALGGRVHQAIVVSPALPEVNSLQRERERIVPGGSQAAFKSVYLIPGLRKISQALGRLVRAPDHSAKVLLHGKRFMQPEYRDLLPSYLQPVDNIITDEEFDKKWLNSR